MIYLFTNKNYLNGHYFYHTRDSSIYRYSIRLREVYKVHIRNDSISFEYLICSTLPSVSKKDMIVREVKETTDEEFIELIQNEIFMKILNKI